jgi:long-chain fatty acid transport protein
MIEPRVNRNFSFAVGLAAALLSSPVMAGGLYIGEFAQPNQGASRAGANALAEDASTALQNPVGVMFLDKPKSMATALLIHAKTKFDQKETFPSGDAVGNNGGTGAASNGGDAGGNSVGGAFFHAHPVNDKWGWGFAFGSISGAVLDYDNGSDFAGRYWATEVDLLTIQTTGSISYKFTDNFAASIHSSLSYGELDLDVYAPGPTPAFDIGEVKVEDGDDTVISYGASAMWQATDKLRLGAMYNSKIEYDFDSDLKIPVAAVGTVNANVELTYPEMIRTSAAYDLNESLTLLGSVAWENWSEFEDIPITTGMGTNALARNWDDTWFCALGLRWKPNNRYTYYTGVAYDTDPSRASDRTADMPMDRQIRLSGGVTYERDNGHKIGGVLTYADYGDGDIDNGGNRPVTGDEWTVKGDYSSNYLVFLGLNYGW